MEAAVKTVDELAQSNAKDLFERLITVNEDRMIVKKLPILTQGEDWVEKGMKAGMEGSS